MQVRKKTTYTVVEFKEGMEDGVYFTAGGEVNYFIIGTDGSKLTISDGDYILKNNFTGEIDLICEKSLKNYYEEI